METLTLKEIEDMPLDERPLYMDSLSDNPYQTRLRGIDVGKNLDKIVMPVEFTITPFDSVFASGAKIIDHNLGYIPGVIGSYEVIATNDTSRWPVGKRGNIPESRQFAPLPSLDFFSVDVMAGQSSQPVAQRDGTKTISIVFTRGSSSAIITLRCKVLLFRERRT